MALELALVLVLGLSIGSFLNVCIWRLPRGQSLLYPPSYCPSCGHRLGALDLVPVFSYLFLKGKCRYCQRNISPAYPLVELTTAVYFTACWQHFGLSWDVVSAWVLGSLLLAISVIDLEHYLIPDVLVVSGVIIGSLIAGLDSWARLKTAWAAGAAGWAFMAFVYWGSLLFLSQEGLGWGDVKLSAMLGVFLGPQKAALAIFLAFVTGGVAGAYLLLRGRKGRKDPIPFGPFLALGALLAFFWGQTVIDWYMGLLFYQ